MAIFVPTRRAVRATPFARRDALSPENLAKAPAPTQPELEAEEKPQLPSRGEEEAVTLLSRAWEVLLSNMKLPVPKAKSVMVESMTAARNCVIAMNDGSRRIAQIHAQKSIHSACLTVARCIDRAPAALHHKLDNEIASILEASVVDTESVECIFEAARRIFAEFPDHEASKTARKLIEPFDPIGHDWNNLHIGRYGALKDYEALSPTATCQVKIALTRLKESTTTKITASMAFQAIAEALTTDWTKRPDAQSNRLIKDYVLAVGKIFQGAGLSIGRARKESDPKYKSPFHRYSDLILAAMNEPWARRHDDNLDEIATGIWKQHAKLPSALRAEISGRLQRVDVQWLVSEDHVRDAVRRLKFCP